MLIYLMPFIMGGLGKLEFIEDDAWQLQIFFFEQRVMVPSTDLIY